MEVFYYWFRSKPHQKNHIRDSVPLIICWEIWLARNRSKHDNGGFNHNHIISQVITHINLIHLTFKWDFNHWIEDQESARHLGIHPVKQKPKTFIGKWSPPPINFIKINIDGAKQVDHSAVGGVARDYTSKFLFAFFEYIGD